MEPTTPVPTDDIDALIILGLAETRVRCNVTYMNIVFPTIETAIMARLSNPVRTYTQTIKDEVKKEVEAGLLLHIAELERQLTGWRDKTVWLGRDEWRDTLVHVADVTTGHTADLITAVVYHQRDTINSLKKKCELNTKSSTPMTIQTKLGIGQEAWFLHENKATTRPVGNIDTSTIETAVDGENSAISSSTTYGFGIYKDHPKTHGEMTWLRLPEHQVFATKEDLLASL